MSQSATMVRKEALKGRPTRENSMTASVSSEIRLLSISIWLFGGMCGATVGYCFSS